MLEAGEKSKVDAALVLGYGFDTVTYQGPNLMGQSAVHVGHSMLREGFVNYVVFAAGKVNKINPKVGESQSKFLLGLEPKVDPSQVICRPLERGTNTWLELEAFKRLALAEGWSNLRVIHSDHHSRVPGYIRQIFGNRKDPLLRVCSEAYEVYLSAEHRWPEYQGLFQRMNAGEGFNEIREFVNYEKFVSTLDRVPCARLAINLLAATPNKGEKASWVVRALSSSSRKFAGTIGLTNKHEA